MQPKNIMVCLTFALAPYMKVDKGLFRRAGGLIALIGTVSLAKGMKGRAVNEIWIVFAIIAAIIVLFMWDRFPVITVCIGAALSLWATGILTLNQSLADRKSTRLNSSHVEISYAVFCLKKKKNNSD